MQSTPSSDTSLLATRTSSNVAPSLAGLNPRSCTVCRRRKVKCDKKMPCGNCVKAGNDCVFPASRGVPQPSNSSYSQTNGRDAQLLARLNKLEKVVKELRHHPDVEEGLPRQFAWNDKATDRETSPSEFALRTDVGRLDISGDGKSRYSSSRLWTTLYDEVQNIREIMDETIDVSTPPDSTEDGDMLVESDRGAFLFGCTCKSQDMLDLHPLPSQIMFYWKTYVENVDPLVKVLHKPSVNILLNNVKDRLDTIDRETEALLFSIYFAAVISMTSDEVETELKQSKATLLRRYKYGIEKALARADFLNTRDLVILQAFVIFLFCLRCYDHSRTTWTLTSVATRLANSLGIHRDGTKFGLSPFDIEMRRRLWWNVRVLHDRASQDFGSSHSLMQDSDALLPLNINDSDIGPSTIIAPSPRIGFTESTFFIVRCERIDVQDKLAAYTDGCLKGIGAKNEQLIRDYQRNYEVKYINHVPNPTGIALLCTIISRLGASKIWISHYQHIRGVCGGDGLPEKEAKHMFSESIQILEESNRLYNEPSLAKWAWLFKSYTNANLVINLHAFVCVANNLIATPNCPESNRAYASLESMCRYWAEKLHIERRRAIWQPVGRLMTKVQSLRGISPSSEGSSGNTGTSSWTVIDHPSGTGSASSLNYANTSPENIHAQSVDAGWVGVAPEFDFSTWDEFGMNLNGNDNGNSNGGVGIHVAQDMQSGVLGNTLGLGGDPNIFAAGEGWPAWMTYGQDYGWGSGDAGGTV